MKENSIKKEQSSIEEDIKDIEKYISFTSKRENFSHDTDWNWNKDLANKIEHVLSDYKRVLEMNKILLKENEQLKNDIKNMYNEEVIISIIEDNFNLCRNEVLELLESEEK